MSSIKRKLLFVILIIAILTIAIILAIKICDKRISQMPEGKFGVTFSKGRAEYLGLDWHDTYSSILDELQVKYLRLGAYWPDVMPKKDVYNFSDLDWMVDEAGNHQAKIILAIGWRLPGWPECHTPDWATNLNGQEHQEQISNLIKETVNRYKSDPQISAWQLENEPFLRSFGICPPLDRDFFKQELALVKSLDDRPIIVTESGELSTWLGGGHYGNVLGITMYRVVWNKYVKYFYYPFPEASYYLKGEIVKLLTGVKKIIVAELQAEPWSPNGSLLTMSLDEQLKVVNLDYMKNVVSYARHTGFSEYYLWGVEWWYWLKNQGHPEVFNFVQELFKSQL
ncbi:MAG: beta-galactosidase [Patescibacteria group bacterium]|nr:beta-galactosidase [Patescibacteria group bacterium]